MRKILESKKRLYEAQQEQILLQKQQEENLKREKEAEKAQHLKKFQDLKKEALQTQENSITQAEKKNLVQEFESMIKNPFHQKMVNIEGGRQILREDFLAKKYLPDHFTEFRKIPQTHQF